MKKPTKDNDLIIGVTVVAIAALLHFGQGVFKSPVARVEEPGAMVEKFDEELLRRLSSTVTYEVPGGTHEVTFAVLVDQDGIVGDTDAVDVLDVSHKANLDKFSGELIKVIEGKKLSDIGAVDKIGSSSLTTNAFNEALPEIKSQL